MTNSIVDQFRMATLRQNRLATGAGFLIGGFVPAATFFLVHFGVAQNQYLWAIVAGGLLFSAKTVYEWGRVAFQSPWKALGFCVLVEGVMTFSPDGLMALSAAGLLMLVVVNGVATGCNLSLNRTETAAKRGRPRKTEIQEEATRQRRAA